MKTNTERNYPTRMHELFQVMPGEINQVEYRGNVFDYWMEQEAGLFRLMARHTGKFRPFVADISFIANIVNHPEKIIRKQQLTEEQLYAMEAVYCVLGMKWLAMDICGEAFFHVNRPTKQYREWTSDLKTFGERRLVKARLAHLVSWKDEEPLDIAQVLRDNGVEV